MLNKYIMGYLDKGKKNNGNHVTFLYYVNDKHKKNKFKKEPEDISDVAIQTARSDAVCCLLGLLVCLLFGVLVLRLRNSDKNEPEGKSVLC